MTKATGVMLTGREGRAIACCLVFVFALASRVGMAAGADDAGVKARRRAMAADGGVTGAVTKPPAEGKPASQRATQPPGPLPLPKGLPDRARFVVVALDKEVSMGMAAFVERVAGGLHAGDVLVLDMNTFGGAVQAAVRIRDTLLHARDRQVWTATFIDPRAISAGALIAYATDIIAVAPGATMGAAAPIQIGPGGEASPAGEKVVSYMRKEMRATAEARGRNGRLAEAMVDADVEVDGLNDKGKLLTLDGKEALAWGVASIEATDLTALIEALGYGAGRKPYEVKRIGWSWAEQLAGWFSGSMVSSLLMTIGMLGLMVGLYTGGSPLPLTVGAACLALFFFGHYVTHLAGIEDILLFVLGVGLLLAELFVAHGAVVFGVLGLLCIIGSLLLGLVDLSRVPLAVQWHTGWIGRALTTVSGSLVATAILGYLVVRLLPATRLGRPLILSTVLNERVLPAAAAGADAVVGAEGLVLSDLRPAGKVRVGGARLDAVAEYGFIGAGARVRVIRRQGYQLVVQAIEEQG